MPDVPAGLAVWARRNGPSSVLQAVRRRAARGYGTERGELRVALNEAQRRDVARLLGTAWEVSRAPLRLQDLAAALAEHGLSVREFIEALDGGPLDDVSARRAAQEARAEAERSAAARLLHDVDISVTDAQAWLSDPSLPRPGDGALLVLTADVVRVWRRLPGNRGRGLRLAELAATVLGDAHALDHRDPRGRVVARLIARVHGLPRPLRPGPDWRGAWSAVGVRCDEVSSRVLVLNLPLQGDAPAARLSAAAPGEPLWLTLRSLTRGWSVPAGCHVFVCENPTVVEAAADELGPSCPPLVCTDGIPSGAALELVLGLAAHGSRISVRADVDAAGLVVVDQVRSVAPEATTWRYDAHVYLGALGLPSSPAPAGPLASRLDQLREAYEEQGQPLHEEVLLDMLLGDLARAAPPCSRASALPSGDHRGRGARERAG